MTTLRSLIKLTQGLQVDCRCFLVHRWRRNRFSSTMTLGFHSLSNTGKSSVRTANFKITHQRVCMTRAPANIKETRYDRFVEIHLDGANTSIFNTTWLRENCHCSECYTEATNQRKSLFHRLKQESFTIHEIKTEDTNTGHTVVKWADGHRSDYKNSWLRQMIQLDRRSAVTSRFLWNKDTFSDILLSNKYQVKFEALIVEKDESLKVLVGNLIRFGVGLVDGCPSNLEATEKAAEKIAPIMTTFYGKSWEFSNKSMDFKDTAYTSDEIGPHNDGTYFISAPGLQVFHCLHHDSSGGETLIVDGFNCAEQLQSQFPQYFKILATERLSHEFADPEMKNQSVEPILKVNPITNEMEWIRYNPYDRAAFTGISQQKLPDVYRSLQQLAAIIEDENNVLKIKLRPGTILFIDNWRVLHGRTFFTGNRHMCGCYISRDDWIRKARNLRLF